MTDVIFEAVSLGVDSVISGSIVSMIVLVLTLSSKLNSYASMQETYAQSITYYRQYSKYNATDIVAADALSALFYYDDNIDIFIVDAELDGAEKALWLYSKTSGYVTTYKAPVTYDAGTDTYSVNFNGTIKSFPGSQKYVMINAMYDYCNQGKLSPYVNDEGNFLTYADISAQVAADSIFSANLLEDLKNTPSVLYSGGTVTGIIIVRQIN